MASGERDQTVTVDGRAIKLTNLDKVLYPLTGTTKGEVIAYYAEIGPLMLPYVYERPATRKRWPDGVGDQAKASTVFFHKNIGAGTPDWVARHTLTHRDGDTTYPVINDLATLTWLAQLAALEIHVPQWRFGADGGVRNPDRLVLDLDPGPGVSLAETAEVALMVRDVLRDIGHDPVPVTSGSKGIHLYAPLDGSQTSDDATLLARELARALEAAHPERVISQMRRADRVGKVFIDWSQNNAAKTTVAPYSLRGRDHPLVAAPRTWAEVESPGLTQLSFTEVLARVPLIGDPLAGLAAPEVLAKLDLARNATSTFLPTSGDVPPQAAATSTFLPTSGDVRQKSTDSERLSPHVGRNVDVAAEAADAPPQVGRYAPVAAGSAPAPPLVGRNAPVAAGSAPAPPLVGRNAPVAAGSAPVPPLVGRNAPAGRFPAPVGAMLATPSDGTDLSDERVWAFEMKWDGVRALAYLASGQVKLVGRKGRDETATYPDLLDSLAALDVRSAVLDGEVVVADAGGRPDFGLLQNRINLSRPADIDRAARVWPAQLMLFDIVELDGESLLDRPYEQRRKLLEHVVRPGPTSRVQVPPIFDGDLESARATSRLLDLEGVVAKRRDSRYEPGRRSARWLKIKNFRTQEVVIGGWHPGRGGRAGVFGGLLMGVPTTDGLRYIGRVGSGFSDRALAAIQAELDQLAQPDCPLSEVPRDDARDAHWVRPALVGEVAYSELTGPGRLRHPVWRGLRPDKSAREVVWEG